MPKRPIDYRSTGILIGLFLAVLFIHYGLERSSPWLVPVYGVAFLFYLYSFLKLKFKRSQLLGVSVLIRLFLFLGLPGLSDDYFRFLWDGQIWASGINPYGFTPMELISQLPEDYNALFQSLNSQAYHSTYPPISQFIFYMPSCFGIQDKFWSVTMIRMVLIGFEVGTIYLLFNLASDISRVALYALNPLVILELTGNLHFEGIVIFFLLLFVWLIRKRKWRQASPVFALGILTKLTPLMFLPVFLRKLGLKYSVLCYGFIGLVMILLTMPFLDLNLITGMGKGLDLFFRKFEFNAGLFFLIREMGFWLKGYDVIQSAGPWLSGIAFLFIVFYSLFFIKKDTPWFNAFVIILFIQLMFATTVHPWYVIPLLAFGAMSGYNFPILWSGLIFLSYLGYTIDGYEHPMIWIAIEYLCVIPYAGYEVLSFNSKLKHV